MREILFRGKRLDNGEWVEGSSLGPSFDSNYYIITCVIGNHRVCGECGCPFDCDDLYEVDPATVGQYTGLCDKNGVKIFEGDIISTDIKRPYLIVEFRDGCFMFNCNDGGEDYYDIMLPICKEAHTEYEYGEVIGNIHEDGDLIDSEI